MDHNLEGMGERTGGEIKVLMGMLVPEICISLHRGKIRVQLECQSSLVIVISRFLDDQESESRSEYMHYTTLKIVSDDSCDG